jgi:long-chain fatty acid transport protein
MRQPHQPKEMSPRVEARNRPEILQEREIPAQAAHHPVSAQVANPNPAAAAIHIHHRRAVVAAVPEAARAPDTPVAVVAAPPEAAAAVPVPAVHRRAVAPRRVRAHDGGNLGDCVMKAEYSYRVISLILFALVFASANTSKGQTANQTVGENLERFFIGEELGVGTRAISMGGAYVGVSDDYSAIYWNPAGLGQIRRMEFNLGFSHSKMANKATYLDTKFDSKNTFSRLNSIGFVFPVPTYQGSLVLGFGYNKVRDFENTLEISGFSLSDSVDQDQSLLETGSLNHFSLAGSMEIQKNFFLGLALNFIGGKDDYSTRTDAYDIYDLYSYEENGELVGDLLHWRDTQNITSEYSATSLKLGALYRVGRTIRIGGAIVSPTKIEIKESWSQQSEDYIAGWQDPITNYSSGGDKYTYSYTEPYSFTFGASARLLNFTLAGDVGFQDWSQAKYNSNPPVDETKADANLSIKQNLQSVTKIRLGGEMYVPIIRARLRLGYYDNPSPYRYSKSRPDKQYLTAGASLMLDKQVMVDLGLSHGTWKVETIDAATNSPTLEDHTFDKIIGTLSIRF